MSQIRVDIVSDTRIFDVEIGGKFYTVNKITDYNSDTTIYICYDSDGIILEGEDIPKAIKEYLYE